MSDSDLKSAKQVISASKTRLSRILQCTASGFWEWYDVSKDEYYWSPECYQLLGYDDGEFTPNSKYLAEMIHPDDHQAVLIYLGAMAVADEPVEAEFRLRMKSGEYRWIRTSGRSFADGNQTSMLCLVSGIDRGSQAELQRRSQAELYRSVFNHSTLGMVISDLEGNFTHVNDTACNLLGFERTELLTKSYADITVPENRQTSHKKFRELLEGVVGGQAIEMRYRRKDGTAFLGAVKLSRLHDFYGNPQYVLACFDDISNRKQAEHRLRTSEEKFRSIYEQSPIAIQQYDVEGNLVGVNSQTLRLFGLDDLEGIQDFNFWNDPNLKDEEAKILKSGHPVHISTSTVLSKGSFPFPKRREGKIYLDMYVTPFRLKTTVAGYLVQIVETTEHVEAETKLRRSEQMFRLFFEQHFLFMAILSPDGTVIEVNDHMLEIRGFHRHDFINKLFWSVPAFDQLPEIRQQIRERIKHIAKSGGHVEVEDNYQTADGMIRTVSAIYTSIKDEEGVLQYIVVQANDITERKLAEQTLRETKQRLQEIADNVQDFFCILSPDWQTILYASPAYERIWGRSLQSLYDAPNSWSHPILPEDLHTVQESMERLMQSGQKGFSFPLYRIKRPDGDIRWIEARGYPVFDANGNIVRIVGAARDVTEQKTAERELRAREAMLAHVTRVNAVGEMAGTLAHELSQPLYAIANYAGTVQYSLERSTKSESVDLMIDSMTQVVSEVKRARAIVTHLRDLVRGREPIRKAVDINTPLQRTIELLTPIARDKSVRLISDLATNLPAIHADPVQIEQVVINLVTNGIDALSELPAERRSISISTHLSENQLVEVVIRDHGPGVDESLRESLFNPFVTTKDEGLGLGLSISRSIINSLGGAIWMDQSFHPGAAFHFTLPPFKVPAQSDV